MKTPGGTADPINDHLNNVQAIHGSLSQGSSGSGTKEDFVASLKALFAAVDDATRQTTDAVRRTALAAWRESARDGIQRVHDEHDTSAIMTHLVSLENTIREIGPERFDRPMVDAKAPVTMDETKIFEMLEARVQSYKWNGDVLNLGCSISDDYIPHAVVYEYLCSLRK